jgi:hypothetical protein
MADNICNECGFRGDPSGSECADLRNMLLARDFEQPVLYWRYHRLAIDTYCVQHGPYVESAKSLAAHLCGLCVALERGNDSELLRANYQWLNGHPELHKPELPTFRGRLTIASVVGIEHSLEYGRAVEQWARSTWDAYQVLHPIAREWLAESLRRTVHHHGR